MIETIVLDYLKTKINPVPVVMEIPKNTVNKFVLIERTGGGETDKVNRATFAIKSYGASLYEAAALNETVKIAMSEITETTAVMACKLNSDYNFTDTTEKRYRYQAVYNITY